MRLLSIILLLLIFYIPSKGQTFYFSELSSNISTYKPQQVLCDLSASIKSEMYSSRGGLGFSLGYSPINDLHLGMHYRIGAEQSDLSLSVGVYKSWYINNKNSFLYHNVYSINANVGYKRSDGLFVPNFSLTQNALFIKIGGLYYYNKVGFNLSYKLFGVHTSKIYVDRFQSVHSDLALEFQNNPKFYSMIDLRFNIKLKRALLFIQRQQLIFHSLKLAENRSTVHLGVEFNLSYVFYPRKKINLFFE